MTNKIELEIFDGPEANEGTLYHLQDWIKKEGISDLQRVEPKREKPKPGQMGADPATILSVILSSAAVVELVRCVHAWLKTRKPKIKMKIKKDKKEISFDIENVKDEDKFIKMVIEQLGP